MTHVMTLCLVVDICLRLEQLQTLLHASRYVNTSVTDSMLNAIGILFEQGCKPTLKARLLHCAVGLYGWTKVLQRLSTFWQLPG